MFWKKKTKDEGPSAQDAIPPEEVRRPEPRPAQAPAPSTPPGDVKGRLVAALAAAAGDRGAPMSREALAAQTQAIDVVIADAESREVVRDILDRKCDRAFATLEGIAQKASAAGAWRVAGALMFCVDGARARKAYEQAFALDNRDLWTCIFLSRLRGMGGDMAGANVAAASAVLVAETIDGRGYANVEMALVSMALKNFEFAAQSAQAAVNAMSGAIAAGARDGATMHEFVGRLVMLGDASIANGDLSVARGAYDRALSEASKLATADARGEGLMRGVAEILEKAALAASGAHDHGVALERANEAVAVRRRLLSAASDKRDETALAGALQTLNEIKRQSGDVASASVH